MEELSVSLPPGPAFEQHYSVRQTAKMWGLGVDVVRRIFENEDGVVKIFSPERLHKRRYTTLRIPESVLRRVHRRLTTTRGKPI